MYPIYPLGGPKPIPALSQGMKAISLPWHYSSCNLDSFGSSVRPFTYPCCHGLNDFTLMIDMKTRGALGGSFGFTVPFQCK